jgi:DEAD/DEAH box helicase domain-containing protein
VPPSAFVVLDVETRYSAAEVGGWQRADRMGVSVVVLYDSRTRSFSPFRQEEIPRLVEILSAAPLIVGFNIRRFDYAVLAPHAPGFSFLSLPTLDLLTEVYGQLSYRISLDNLATATLNSAKSADGLMALKWWKEQRLAEIEEYCRKDVELTRDLYLFGRDNGYLLFTNKAGQKVRVRAAWSSCPPPSFGELGGKRGI